MARKKEISPQYCKKIMVEATMLEVISPCHFIVRETPNASMSREAAQFLAMEGRLNKYYTSREVVYCSMPEKDEVVVILPEGEDKWYRARVIYVLETTRGPCVNCYLLDYGGRRMVSRERMYKIAEDFLSVPFQAVDFILLGIKPIAMQMDAMLNITYGPVEEWDCASKEYVETLCAKMEAAFMGILGFDSDGHVYGNLYIEDGGHRFCLNEVLVTQKYAILSKEECESIQMCDSIELNNVVEHVKSPVNSQTIPLPENYTLERYLGELFDDDAKLSKDKLKSLRKSLENKGEDEEAQTSDVTSGSLYEAKPKTCLSKQYLNMKTTLIKSRPCSKIHQKNISSSRNESSGTENAVASNLKSCPQLSSSLQHETCNLYKKNLAACKFTSSQMSKLSASSQSSEEKTDKLSSPGVSSCSVLCFSTDDESSKHPSTPFPEEEARCQVGPKSSKSSCHETSFIKNTTVAFEQKIGNQKISSCFSSNNGLHKKSPPLNVHCNNVSVGLNSLSNTNPHRYPIHAIPNHKHEAPSGPVSLKSCSQKLRLCSLNSVDSDTTHVTSKHSHNKSHHSDFSPEQDVGNCTASSSTSSSVTCVRNVSASHSSKNVNYSYLQKKLHRFSKDRIPSDKGSLSINSQQSECTSDSLQTRTNSFSHRNDKLSCDQTNVSLPVPARYLSKGTAYGLLRSKLLRLQKDRVVSVNSVSNVSSPSLDTRSQPKSLSSLEKYDSSLSRDHELSSDRATASLSVATLSCSTSSSNLTAPVQPLIQSAESEDSSREVQSLQKMSQDSSNKVACAKNLASVPQENASSLLHKQVPSHCNEQLSPKELSSVAQKKFPVAKYNSVTKMDLADEQQNQTRFADAQGGMLLSEQDSMPLCTTPSKEVLSKKDDKKCLQNGPLSWQSNGKKISVDELFACCKDQGETATSSYTPSSSKILEHVRKAFKKGMLHPFNQKSQQRSIPKSSPVTSVTGHEKSQVRNTLVDTSGNSHKPPQLCSMGISKNMELGDVHDDVCNLPSKTDQDVDSIERNLSDSDSGHATIVDVPQPNGCGLKNSPVQTSEFQNEQNKVKSADNSRTETSLNSGNKEKFASESHCNGDLCTLKDENGSGDSENSSDSEDNAIYRSTTHSIVQSLTQQIIDANNSLCGQYFKTELDFSDKSLWEMASIPAVSIGNCVPPPLLRTEEVPFTDQMRKRLKELHFWGPSCIQSVVWPAVFRNRSFAAIAPPASGKTIAYLLPLLSMLIDGTKYEDLPASHGAVILILCSTWMKVVKLYGQCMNLLDGINKIKVKVLYEGGGDKDQEVFLFNGCDILISTPSSFLHYLHKKATNFDRCCNIMLDDGAKLIEHFKDEISSIMQELLVHIKRKKKTAVALQIGICSEKWTKGVASFAEKFLLMPLFFFTSFLEAAVYSEISMYIHSCTIQTIDFILLGLLDGIICPKAVICTRDVETAKHVHGVLQTNAVFSMLAHHNKPHYELTAVKRHWNLHHRHDSTFILVVTDTALLTLNVRDADCIIHYDLPEISRLSFSQRFGCCGDYFSGGRDPNGKKPLCHVFITEECKIQAPTLVKLMNRMGRDYPKQLLQFANEQKRLSMNRHEGALCNYMKAFGFCEDSHCIQRHVIVKESDSPTIVPKQGEIKAVVTEVIDTSHCYIKILEYTDPVNSSTTVVSAEYMRMFVDLKTHYSQAANKIVPENVKNGEVYGTEESPSVFHRVRVLQILSLPNRDTQRVKVFFLDDGWIREKEIGHLLVLPAEFQSHSQMCVEAYLSNVKAVDSCNQWTPQANLFVSKLITGKVIHATIALCLGDTIWLDPLVLKEGNSVNILRLDRTLKRLGLALPNVDHLPLLYKSCADQIDLPVMSNLKSGKKSEPLQKVEYAFLDLGVFENVYLPDVISPQEFFVQRCKFYDRLSILEKDISCMCEKRELKKCRSVRDGMFCIASFPDEGKFYRAQVQGFSDAERTEVNLFFVDYGDSGTSHKSNLYILPPKFLLLPFQAIECELAGISAPQGEWPAEAGDMLFDLTRYENGDLKTLTAKALKRMSSVTGGNLYTIQLFDGSFNISEHLVESGLAVTAQLPELPVLPSDDHDKPDVHMDDIPSGYISACSNDSADTADLEASALFCAALCGLYTPQVNGFSNTDKTETSCPTASIEEVIESTPPSQCDVKQHDSSPQESLATDTLNYSPKSLKPHITWWDTPGEVFISIKLVGVQSYDLYPFTDGFSFSTNLGDKHYFVEVTFFAEVIPDQTIVDCQGQCVRISFIKKESKKWPCLTHQNGKVFYIQRDLDHIDTESENELCETPDIFKAPRTPVKKEDIRHVCSTTEAETSSDDSDYDSSWKRVCQPKEM